MKTDKRPFIRDLSDMELLELSPKDESQTLEDNKPFQAVNIGGCTYLRAVQHKFPIENKPNERTKQSPEKKRR